jgi:hypothetical protein
MVSLGKIKQVGNVYYDNDKTESDGTLYSYFAVLETHAKSIKLSIGKQLTENIKQPSEIKKAASTSVGDLKSISKEILNDIGNIAKLSTYNNSKF